MLNTVKVKYNGQGCEKELLTTSGQQIQQIDKGFNPTTLTSESRQERLGDRQNPSPGGIVQLEIQKDACGRETTRNTLINH
jgi:hypothetical protein